MKIYEAIFTHNNSNAYCDMDIYAEGGTIEEAHELATAMCKGSLAGWSYHSLRLAKSYANTDHFQLISARS